jgi:hypothetical protein
MTPDEYKKDVDRRFLRFFIPFAAVVVAFVLLLYFSVY